MYRFEVKRATPIAIFLFVFLLIANNFTLSSNSDKGHELLIKTGEKCLLDGEYEKAVEIFQEAITLIKTKKKLAQLFQLLSLVYYKMGDKERCEESLREMFEQNPDTRINAKEYEDVYKMIFNKVKAEYWYVLRTMNEEEEETEQKIIEKLANKPKKKKNKLIRILVITGMAVLLGVATALLLITSDQNQPQKIPAGRVEIYNQSLITVWFSFLDISDVLAPLNSKLYGLEQGVYDITFFNDSHSLTKTFRIYHQRVTRVIFKGWDESTVVRKNQL